MVGNSVMNCIINSFKPKLPQTRQKSYTRRRGGKTRPGITRGSMAYTNKKLINL